MRISRTVLYLLLTIILLMGAGIATSGQIQVGGGGGTVAGAIGGARSAVKTSDETLASTNYQDDDDLAFAVGANETWIATWHIEYDAAATDDMKIAFSGPSGASEVTSVVALITSAVTYSGDVLMPSMVSLADDSYTVGGAGSGTVVSCLLHMTVTTASTSGTIRFRWARSAGSGNVIVKAKSSVYAVRVS